MSWDMKRIAIAGAGCLLTLGLAVFAVALAQRDSRDRESVLETVDPDYAHQKPEPIALPAIANEQTSDPTNFLRTIVEPIMQPMPEDVSIAPLDSSPTESWDEDLANELVDQSQMVLASGEQPLPASQPSLAPPPGLLPPPQTGPNVPRLSRTNPSESNSIAAPNFPTPQALPPAPSSLAKEPAAPPAIIPPAIIPPAAPNLAPLPPQETIPSALANAPSTALSAAPKLPAANATPSYPPAVPLPSLSQHQADLAAPTSTTPPPREKSPPSIPVVRQNEMPRNEIAMMARATQLASAAPGNRQMDGAQNPSLQIQKRAPEEVQVGQPATFALLVRNVGNATAYEVAVTDSVPRGTRLLKTSPTAESRPDGTLVWSLGEMKAGSEQVLTVELIPETEGEIGSVASVNFAAQASVRTVSTQPKLTIKQVADDTVLMGKSLRIQVTVTNEGTGVARGVSLEEDVPAGLRHPLGATLGVPLGDLVPGQSRSTELELTATTPGQVRNTMRAVAANTAGADSAIDVHVVAPQLKVATSGPSLRYLERQATYQISVTNHGTSTAYNVEIVANLPRGLQYNASGNHGEYHSNEHAVSWGLEELAVGATATTDLTLLPVEEGEYAIRLQAQAIGIQSEPFEKQVRVEGQSELAFSIDDDNDPIEVDGQTTYAVTITNNGTRVDEDVQVMIELPKGARALQVNGPVGFQETAQGLLFDPISQMRAKDRQIFRFSVQLNQPGVQVVRAHVKSKLRPIAVVNEESTEVYRDQ
jgi:uncharacterized repeat protein (TIGR01451 family)